MIFFKSIKCHTFSKPQTWPDLNDDYDDDNDNNCVDNNNNINNTDTDNINNDNKEKEEDKETFFLGQFLSNSNAQYSI